MAMNRTKSYYLQAESECLMAIVDLKSINSVEKWLSQYEILYDSIRIKPEGLPAIIDFNFEGESFIGIHKFGRLYEMIKGIFE
jgi:hypothetical protein